MKRAALNIEGAKITVAVASGIASIGRMTVNKRMEVALPETEQERVEELKKLLVTLHDDHGVKGVFIGLNSFPTGSSHPNFRQAASLRITPSFKSCMLPCIKFLPWKISISIVGI